MNLKTTYIYFSVATAAAAVLRLFLIIYAIDPSSGFIREEAVALSVFMLVMIALAAALVFFFSLGIKTPIQHKTNSGGVLVKTVSVLFGFTVLCETLFSPLASMAPVWQKTAELILALATFLSLVYSAFADRLKMPSYPILAIVPILFWLIRLVGVFTVFSTFSMITDIFFELAALCALLAGFLMYAKCENLERSPKLQKRALAICLFASSLAFITSVPKILLNISGNAELMHINVVPAYSTFLGAVFLLIFSIVSFKEVKENEE